MDVVETKSAQFHGNVYDGTITLGNKKWELSVDYASKARLQIFSGGNIGDNIFHFGIIFENPTFSMKCNG